MAGDESKSIVGLCASVRDSNRSVTSVRLEVGTSATSSFTDLGGEPVDDPGIFEGLDGYNSTVTVFGSADETWSRVPLGALSGGLRPSPGEGNFNLLNYGCACCPCRVAYVFGDDLVPPAQHDDPGGTLGVQIPMTDDASTDAPPPADPPDASASFTFNPAETMPCKQAGGPMLPGVSEPIVRCYVTLPELPPFHSYASPADPDHPLVTTVSGSDGAEIDSTLADGTVVVKFTTPPQCDATHVFFAEVDYSNDFTDEHELSHSVTATTTLTLTIA